MPEQIWICTCCTSAKHQPDERTMGTSQNGMAGDGMNKHDIEQLLQICDDIDTLMQSQFDQEQKLTDDQIMNMLIGINELHKQRINLYKQKIENEPRRTN